MRKCVRGDCRIKERLSTADQEKRRESRKETERQIERELGVKHREKAWNGEMERGVLAT